MSYTKQPILITGIPRSGASMIAGIIELCGARTGNLNVMNENIAARQLQDNLMRRLYVDVKGQYPLPVVSRLNPVIGWTNEIHNAVTNKKAGEWMFKDNRILLTWPIWNAAFPKAKWIIVRRKREDIIKSCKQTAYMKAFKNPKVLAALKLENEDAGWEWMIQQYEKRIEEMKMTLYHMAVVYPEKMVDDDYTEIRSIIEKWLGLQWNDEVQDYMDNKLRKVKS